LHGGIINPPGEQPDGGREGDPGAISETLNTTRAWLSGRPRWETWPTLPRVTATINLSSNHFPRWPMVQNNGYACAVIHASTASTEGYTLITITKKLLYFAQGNQLKAAMWTLQPPIFNATILHFHCIPYPCQLLFSADTAFIPYGHLYQHTPTRQKARSSVRRLTAENVVTQP